MGIISMVVAISMLQHLGRRGTVTISDDGANPNVHWSIAPIVTNFPIYLINYYNI